MANVVVNRSNRETPLPAALEGCRVKIGSQNPAAGPQDALKLLGDEGKVPAIAQAEAESHKINRP